MVAGRDLRETAEELRKAAVGDGRSWAGKCVKRRAGARTLHGRRRGRCLIDVVVKLEEGLHQPDERGAELRVQIDGGSSASALKLR